MGHLLQQAGTIAHLGGVLFCDVFVSSSTVTVDLSFHISHAIGFLLLPMACRSRPRLHGIRRV
jgi:hypothetical protein